MSVVHDENDRDLITRAMLGEEEDFARLVELHYDRIYALAYRWLGHREDAQDAAQEACIKLARALPSYRFEAPFRIWVARIVMNTAKDMLRRRQRKYKRETELFEDMEVAAPTENPEKLSMARQFLRIASTLPEGLREAVLLVFGEEMSHAEAALLLGISESTVSWRIHEARKQLKSMMEGRDSHAG